MMNTKLRTWQLTNANSIGNYKRIFINISTYNESGCVCVCVFVDKTLHCHSSTAEIVA